MIKGIGSCDTREAVVEDGRQAAYEVARSASSPLIRGPSNKLSVTSVDVPVS